jgi:four helix bundle protein
VSVVSGQKMESEVQTTRRPAGGFEDLKVFKLAYRLALEVHRASLGFPAVEQYGLADQVRRASKSICANIAEGVGKQAGSPAECGRFLAMALGSADEMRVWLRFCLDLGYIDVAAWQRWRDAYQEVAQMLQGLRRSIGRPPKSPSKSSDH